MSLLAMLNCLSARKTSSNSTFEQKDRSDSQVRSILLMVRVKILLVLCGLAIGLGIGAYELLSNQEFGRFNRNFDDMSIQVSHGFHNYYTHYQLAQQVTSSIHRSYIRESNHGLMPNETLPGSLLTNDRYKELDFYAHNYVQTLTCIDFEAIFSDLTNLEQSRIFR